MYKTYWRKVVFILIIVCIAVIANYPWYKRSNVSDGYVSAFVHGSDVDYFTYLTFIREGGLGRWMVADLFTNDETESSYIYTFYIVAGRIGVLFGMSPIQIYHTTRIVGVILFAFIIYELHSYFNRKKDVFIAAFIGAVSTTPVTVSFIFDYLHVEYSSIERWWSNLDPLFRFDYVPHHTFGIATMLLSLFSVFRYIDTGVKKFLIIACVFAVVSTFSYPAPASVLLIGLPVAGFIWMVRSMILAREKEPRVIISTLTIAICTAIVIVLLQHEISKGFPWTQWRIWDVSIWNDRPNFFKELVLAQGLTFVMALPSMVLSLTRPKDFRDYFLVIWALLPMALYLLYLRFEIAVIRLVFLGTFIPTELFAVRTMRLILSPSRIYPFVPLIGGVVLFCVQFPAYKFNFIQKMNAYSYTNTDIQTPRSVMDAVSYLALNGKPYAVVLSDNQIGLMLPAFAQVKSYFAHPIHTMFFFDKLNRTNAFFRGALNPNGLKATLEQGEISYIFWGPDEKRSGYDITKYGLSMVERYANNDVTVFELIK